MTGPLPTISGTAGPTVGLPTALGDHSATIRAHPPRVTCAPGGWGYACHMLVVVVLLPIVLMVVACLLERFEAHAVAEKPAPRVRRPLAIEPSAPSLTLVPGEDEDGEVAPTPAASAPLRAAS